MGTYVTTATALQTLMIGTTFDTATTIPLATKCITLAENRINQALSTRYDVSDFLATNAAIPPILTSWTEQLAVGYMYRYMSRGIGDTTDRDKAYIDTVESQLKLLTEGKINLLDTSGAQVSEQTGVLANTDSYSTTFDEDDPLNWAVDTDKLDAISDDRE